MSDCARHSDEWCVWCLYQLNRKHYILCISAHSLLRPQFGAAFSIRLKGMRWQSDMAIRTNARCSKLIYFACCLVFSTSFALLGEINYNQIAGLDGFMWNLKSELARLLFRFPRDAQWHFNVFFMEKRSMKREWGGKKKKCSLLFNQQKIAAAVESATEMATKQDPASNDW